MILYRENPKYTIRKLLELISAYSKVPGYKISTWKSFAFLDTNNEKSEREIKEINPLITATNKKRYLGEELEYKESWALKHWCFWTVVLKTLESPLDSKEIQPVNPKGYQSWIFTGNTDAEAETPILWLPDAKNWVLGKDPDAGKDWRQKKGTTENEKVGWHHQLDGHEFE